MTQSHTLNFLDWTQKKTKLIERTERGSVLKFKQAQLTLSKLFLLLFFNVVTLFPHNLKDWRSNQQKLKLNKKVEQTTKNQSNWKSRKERKTRKMMSLFCSSGICCSSSSNVNRNLKCDSGLLFFLCVSSVAVALSTNDDECLFVFSFAAAAAAEVKTASKCSTFFCCCDSLPS